MSRTRRGLKTAGVCAVLAALQGGCASSPQAPSAGADALSPERSPRGNPPFYEVEGSRYYVLDSSEGFVERGIASWYGRRFHSRPTSSGEPYDMYAMTAAHKTLPLPTWVEVTNLENGKRVIVRVNDRGPFVDDRVIDLSYAAADELDMVSAGTARVEVRALGASPAVAADESEPPARGPRSGRGLSLVSEASAARPPAGERPSLFIQVGAFGERDNAARLVERLRERGFANAFVVTDGGSGGRLHRVRVGPFADVAEYDRANDGLRRLGVGETHLVVDR